MMTTNGAAVIILEILNVIRWGFILKTSIGQLSQYYIDIISIENQIEILLSDKLGHAYGAGFLGILLTIGIVLLFLTKEKLNREAAGNIIGLATNQYLEISLVLYKYIFNYGDTIKWNNITC